MSQLAVRLDGTIEFIYCDDLRGILKQGVHDIKRVSTVEPVHGGWAADLAPVFGPVLGPFETRQEALDAEVKWLEENRLS